MYDTTLGIRVLYGAEARLFASAARSLTDQLRDFVPNPESQPSEYLIGIPVLDSLTAAQVIVLIDRVTAYLLDPSIVAPPRTAVLDATIAAIFEQVSTDVEVEIEMESESDMAEENDTSLRIEIAEASLQTSDPQDSCLDTPDPECAVFDTWQLVIERLCSRVLQDTDWQLEPTMLDLDPHESAVLKGNMGIDDDYFIDIVADASLEDAAAAWCNLLERITGSRPEKWQFCGGLPAPNAPEIPPQFDILSFPDNSQATIHPTEKRTEFKQTKPVLLSDVISEMELSDEEWSSYLNRKTGEIVGLPSQTVTFVEDGEDPDGSMGECGKDFLELARKICNSDDFLSLPTEFDIHEWSIMRDFCETVDSESDREMLLEAIHGSGAFRFFKSTIDRLGLQSDWYDYKELAVERIVIDWLESESIQWSRTKPGEAPF